MAAAPLHFASHVQSAHIQLHLLILMSLRTCLTFLLLYNTKGDVLKAALVVLFHTIAINGD